MNSGEVATGSQIVIPFPLMMENPIAAMVLPAGFASFEFKVIYAQKVPDALLRGQLLQREAEIIGTVIAADCRAIRINAAEMLCRQMAAWHPDRLAQRRDVRGDTTRSAAKTGDVISHGRFPRLELYNTRAEGASGGGRNGRLEGWKVGWMLSWLIHPSTLPFFHSLCRSFRLATAGNVGYDVTEK